MVKAGGACPLARSFRACSQVSRTYSRMYSPSCEDVGIATAAHTCTRHRSRMNSSSHMYSPSFEDAEVLRTLGFGYEKCVRSKYIRYGV